MRNGENCMFPTLIFWVVLFGILGGAGYLVYSKIIVPATNSGRLLKVQNEMKNFFLLARDYANDHSGQYWENGKFPFGAHKVRFEYKYRYFADDADDNGEDKSGMFVLLAVPISLSKGKQAYYIDESGTLFVAELTSPARYETIANMSFDDINWDIPAMAMKPSRCDIKGVEFMNFSSGSTVGK